MLFPGKLILEIKIVIEIELGKIGIRIRMENKKSLKISNDK